VATTAELLVSTQLALVSSPPSFAGYQGVTTSAAWAGWGTIGLDTVITDNYSGWSSARPTRYTAPWSGWYEAAGVASYPINPTGFRSATLGVNGNRIHDGQDWPANSDYTVIATGQSLIYMNAGDYVELFGYVGGTTLGTAILLPGCSRLDVSWKHP